MASCFVTSIEEFPFVTLQLSSPQTNNLLTVEGMRELITAIRHYNGLEQVQVILLTGAEDCFCMGGNLGNRFEQTSEDILAFADVLVELHKCVRESPKITAAAVNGRTGGGGVSLLDACDFAVAAENATFEFPETPAGLAPMISIVGVCNTLPKKTCMELFAFGDSWTADRALQYQLINRVVPAGQVLDGAKKILTPLISMNTHAYQVCKRYYQQIQGLDYSRQLDIGKQFLVSMLKGQ